MKLYLRRTLVLSQHNQGFQQPFKAIGNQKENLLTSKHYVLKYFHLIFEKIITTMKSFIAIMAIFFCSSTMLHAQQYDSIPAYQKDSTIPEFSIMQTDSSWFVKEFLPPNKPVIIIYFSPDCGHCQLTAKDFEKQRDKMKDIFFVWVSYLPMDKIKSFAEEYKMT